MPRKRKQATGFFQQLDFSAGMIVDVAPELLPDNGSPFIKNMLIDQAGRLYKMGGWQSYSTQIMTSGSPRAVFAPTYPLASNATIVLAVESDHLYRFSATTKTDVGALFASTLYPQFTLAIDKTVITDAPGGTAGGLNLNTTPAAPKKVTWDGATATLAALGGTPPAARFSAYYKNRLVLGGTSANANRLYFSPAPNIEAAWDTTNSWVDCDHIISGLCALRNMLLIFSPGAIERIIGDTPPPGDNMDRALLTNMGAIDHRSITTWNDNCIFKNAAGVWITNGGPPQNLAEGRMASKFRADGGGSGPAIGVYRDYLIVGGKYVCHLPTRRWVSLDLGGSAIVSALANDPVTDELYAVGLSNGTVNQYPVMALSHLWAPTSSNKNTAQGVAVTAAVKSRPVGAGVNLKRVGRVQVTYDLRDAASDNPTLIAYKYSTFDTDVGSADAIGTLAETSVVTRASVAGGFERAAPTLYFIQATASSSFKLYGFEAEVTEMPVGYAVAAS